MFDSEFIDSCNKLELADLRKYTNILDRSLVFKYCSKIDSAIEYLLANSNNYGIVDDLISNSIDVRIIYRQSFPF